MTDPLLRQQNATLDARIAAKLQAAIIQGDSKLVFELCQALIRDDFDDFERHAILGEAQLRLQIHEIIDQALRQVLLTEGEPEQLWRKLILPDNYGLFECSMLTSNARWLRLFGSELPDQGLEALDVRALALQNLEQQARILGRFCAVNDGATEVDYTVLREALDPRLLPFLQDWLATVHYLSPNRFETMPASGFQEAALTALLQARRHDHEPLPASSNQSGPAFRAPYFTDANTIDLSIEFHGRQMTSLMERFAPDEANRAELRESTLDVTRLEEVEPSDELIICPNWGSSHVIYRCMSALVENMRNRGAPLIRVHPASEIPQPVERMWLKNTVDLPHNEEFALAHIGAINEALAERRADFAFFPEIVPANSSSWMAMARIARVQATGYGFPVTSGLPTMDYFIGGREVESTGAAANYSEQLILLPGLGVGATAPPAPTAPRERPCDGKLDPADPLRVVSTTSHQKLNAELLAAWDELFGAHPGAHLDLFTNMTVTQIELHQAALGRMLSRGQVTLHTAQSRSAVIQALAEADLYLDAFPYGGFNSLVEPLTVGCPVVTLAGKHARNRLGAALLARVGLPNSLVAHDFGEYIATAARLLSDPIDRLAIRAQIGTPEEVLARINDSDLPDHMDAAITWMRTQGPSKVSRSKAPIFIQAGEKPVTIPA